MAILKHIASKNADYGEAQRYLMFQYDKNTNKPPLDENGDQKELNTICSNVDMILGRPHSRQTEKEKNTDIS